MNPSTQLRALEGEIERLDKRHLSPTTTSPYIIVMHQLLTIAQELEAERDFARGLERELLKEKEENLLLSDAYRRMWEASSTPYRRPKLTKQSMKTADILKANEWEFYPSIDRGGVAQPEYWTHPDHNGPFTEEEAFRQHESDHSGLDGLINQWAETNNALQRELSQAREEIARLKKFSPNR